MFTKAQNNHVKLEKVSKEKVTKIEKDLPDGVTGYKIDFEEKKALSCSKISDSSEVSMPNSSVNEICIDFSNSNTSNHESLSDFEESPTQVIETDIITHMSIGQEMHLHNSSYLLRHPNTNGSGINKGNFGNSKSKKSKLRRASHKTKSDPSYDKPLQMQPVALCGPVSMQSLGGKKYILIEEYLASVGITHKFSAPRTPQQNGVVQMASTVTSTNNLSLRSILEKDKLTGPNFLDWERNLMIVLRHERKWYVLEETLGEAPPATASAAARNAHKNHSDDLLDVACLMLATMSPDLQAGLINTNAYDMIRQLRDMFQTQARTERYDATKAFNECKMIKGTSVSDHVMKMKRHLDHLERLGHPVPLQLATDTILNSLSDDYKPFVVNYDMNNMEKSIAELHSMLKTAELNMGTKNKTKDILMVRDGGVKKKNGHTSPSKGKGPVQAVRSAPKKGKGKGKGKKVKPNKARTENRCFTCNEVGHWRQNCPKRHEAGGQ
ncbi:hypothetical protein OSB04_024336 [Centaurea solstitialis]|uniref:CCHC-type domain-containing protein n=1 Tax=Centaurea solstitialis TaxID=347529 RepID=A0AA38SMJ8_9ASTR|nr:hypothetical protein OSB04_024336 [Centaurea solstitialis]